MKWFNNLSYRMKIVIPIGLFGFIIVTMLALSVSGINQVKFAVDSVSKTHMPGVTYLLEANTSLHRALVSERSVLFTDVGSAEYTQLLQQHKASIQDTENKVQAASGLLQDSEYQQKSSQFQAAFDKWKTETNEVIRQRNTDTRAGRNLAIDISFNAARNSFDQLGSILGDMIAIEQKVTNATTEQSSHLTDSTRAILLSSGAAAIVLCIFLVTIFPGFITRRLTAILHSLEDITLGEGDLTKRLDDMGNDEIGRIASTYNTFVGKIHDVLVTVRLATDNIVNGSNEIASGNTNLSQRTEEQASSLEETAASMEEMTGTIKQNADSAAEATRLADSSRDIAQTGTDVVSRTVDAMSEINTSSARIVDIISTIDGIAFQTNLLALNAAVEAARAGEQGRGFAVVASEVRSLAQRSAEASKEITDLINDSVNKVKIGTELVDESGKTLEEIITGTQQLADIIAEISTASHEQTAGIIQVNNAVTQMDDMTQENAALVEEAAAASRSMEQQAEVLLKQVNFFKLNVADSGYETAPAQANATLVHSNTSYGSTTANKPSLVADNTRRQTASANLNKWQSF
jgi:methyl-accepting chemotaxis protein